jgi:AmmeMemoRadiSam system protein B
LETRLSQLAGKWYPSIARAINGEINGWKDYIDSGKKPVGKALGLMVPHAGWFFSGKLAAKTLSWAVNSFGTETVDLVLVLGGHLAPENPFVYFEDNFWDSPLGPLELTKDQKLLSLLDSKDNIPWQGPTNDNTIEIQLPLVKHYCPQAKIWPLRVPPNQKAINFGQKLGNYLKEGKNILILASSDLTHYGEAYGLAPAGAGEAGEEYRRKNDLAFLEATLNLDSSGLLKIAREKQAACSAGAVATLTEAAKTCGATGFLVDHYSSYDISQGDMSVGYAGLIFSLT